MLRLAPRLMAVFLSGIALAGCARFSSDAPKQAAVAPKDNTVAADKTAPTDLDSGIRQAQLLRVASHYDEAIHILSQLMLVASDDPRVVSEYGKALAQQGRAQDATEFLNRAIELSANDWTLYSALGVSYDQLGNQASARVAYEHALVLKPNEASVLNNYALSRMLAGDTDGARILMARAEAAGGATDSKIAANIALVNKLAPTKAEAIAVAPKPVAPIAQNAPRPSQPMPAQPAPLPIASAALPAAQKPAALVQNAPRALAAQPQQQQTQQPSGVVMQAVPFDPLAGPVKVASHKPAPKSVAEAAGKPTDALVPPVIIIDRSATAKATDAKPADSKTAAKIKPADTKTKDAIPALRLTADARS